MNSGSIFFYVRGFVGFLATDFQKATQVSCVILQSFKSFWNLRSIDNLITCVWRCHRLPRAWWKKIELISTPILNSCYCVDLKQVEMLWAQVRTFSKSQSQEYMYSKVPTLSYIFLHPDHVPKKCEWNCVLSESNSLHQRIAYL